MQKNPAAFLWKTAGFWSVKKPAASSYTVGATIRRPRNNCRAIVVVFEENKNNRPWRCNFVPKLPDDQWSPLQCIPPVFDISVLFWYTIVRKYRYICECIRKIKIYIANTKNGWFRVFVKAHSYEHIKKWSGLAPAPQWVMILYFACTPVEKYCCFINLLFWKQFLHHLHP